MTSKSLGRRFGKQCSDHSLSQTLKPKIIMGTINNIALSQLVDHIPYIMTSQLFCNKSIIY